MKILVIDYAREIGGGSTISDNIINSLYKDSRLKWLIITSKFKTKEKNNFKNLKITSIKKSLFHRYLFEKYYLYKIIKVFQPDLIISTQNIPVRYYKGVQIVYFHQALPFSNKYILRSGGFLKSIKLLIMRYKFIRSFKKDFIFVVQTKSMKNLLNRYTSNVLINFPDLNQSSPTIHKKTNNFIYPTNTENYKRLDIILYISKIIKNYNIESIIYLTLNGNENKKITLFKNEVINNNLPIKFIGKQSKDEMKTLYNNNNLLFTSEIESLGLPLVEAMHYGCMILALETEVTKEITNEYPNIKLFNEENIEKAVLEFFKNNKPSKGLNKNGMDFLEFLIQNKFVRK